MLLQLKFIFNEIDENKDGLISSEEVMNSSIDEYERGLMETFSNEQSDEEDDDKEDDNEVETHGESDDWPREDL